MNLRPLLKHYFRVEVRRSKDQLAMDFGEYPPYPLSCSDDGSVVRIVRAAGLGALLNCFQISRKWIVLSGSGPDARIDFAIAAQLREHGGLELVNLLNNLSHKGNRNIRPLMLGIFRSTYIVLQTAMLSRVIYRRERGLGVFLPMDPYTGQITLKDVIRLEKIDVEPILSHEHIHFLQHQNGVDDSKEMRNESELIPEKNRKNRTLLYILERKEVEARLHEIVLSFYRVKKELPVTLDGFLNLLGSSSHFREKVIVPLMMHGYAFRDPDAIHEERSEMFVSQLGDVFPYMKDAHCEYRFVTEVLAVMYGNLLEYYGAKVASGEYLATVPRPNLYDVLYGRAPVPRVASSVSSAPDSANTDTCKLDC